MQNQFNFPIFKTRMNGPTFRLEDPKERRKYFDLKAGRELKKIRGYLKRRTFMAFLLGPKNSGKGTYAKLFLEALGEDLISHLSVGDIVRNASRNLTDTEQKKVHPRDWNRYAKSHEDIRTLSDFLKDNYRGFIPVGQIMDIISGRDTKTLLPTEVILALIEREINKLNGRAVFIDGFPRNLDQVSTALYFKKLMNYRHDPDFFIFIDVPETIIDERFKQRVVCPQCQTPRGLKLLRTRSVGYDHAQKIFYLICDGPDCNGRRLVTKEGDNLGIESIRERLETDKKVMLQLLKLEGVPKVLLRNSVPVKVAGRYVNNYELTPTSSYEWDGVNRRVNVIEEPWVVNDEEGIPSHSLLPPAVVVSFIKQTAKVLGL